VYANQNGKVRLHFTVSPEHQAKFEELTANAKANCPISKLFNAPITLNAKLV
ncbi:MAG: hypothetical protein RLZZ69_3121, partial [Cyanobacteriota bacterium]